MTISAGIGEALTLISASAGSGKTHQVSKVVAAAVDPANPLAVDLGGLFAVTYTRKGAAELTARIRQTFIAAGAHDRAQELPLAYIGTVHAVCLRIVREFAIDAGLSPLVDVVPGGEARLLREALEWGVDPEPRARVQELAERLELRLDPKVQRVDWLAPVQDIMTLARSNRIRPDALTAMAERSAHRLLELMGPPEPDGAALERALVHALKEAARALNQIHDEQKNTSTTRDTVLTAIVKAEGRALPWSEWVRLQRLAPGKSAMAAVAPVKSIAARVDGHPRLQAEIRELTLAIYSIARDGLEAYDAWKKRRRVVDFVDMIDRALTLIEYPDVKAELAQRSRLLVVDELQDTSPAQLALFVRLHQIAGRSTWVGDRKQCIFEYAGADPALMEAATAWGRNSGGTVKHLLDNWRSRPELVDIFSRLFSAAFAKYGYEPAEVEMVAQRTTPAGLANLPPLGVWSLEATKQAEDSEAIAEGVRRMLQEAAATPVVEKTTNAVRDLQPGDIAVLVATNAEAVRLATALARRGVRSAIARAGLLATPEAKVVTAALRNLLDPDDSLALAEIEALTGFAGMDAESWLDGIIAVESERRAARAKGEQPPVAASSGLALKLDALRAGINAMAPSEVLDSVLASLDLAGRCVRWPEPEQRLANIDALRALTALYEERSLRQREAATIAGLLRFLAEAAEKVLVRDEEIASDDQHMSVGRNAVTITTYHRSKGLEWPVVILGSLDRASRRDAFEVSPESDRPTFDAADPLGGRWIRYWPWPYGQMKTTRLAEAVATSPEGLEVATREERERVRLLYVGFTRARDHLVLAARAGKSGLKTAWLDELSDDIRKPLLKLPTVVDATERATVGIRGRDGQLTQVAARHWLLSGSTEGIPLPSAESHRWVVSPEAATSDRPPYRIMPSRAATDWPDLPVSTVAEVESTGPPIPLGNSRGIDWDVVGNTLHAFLAADLLELDRGQRLERAQRLLAAADLLGLLAPEALVQAGDNLRKWVASRWPNAIWHREIPITAVIATPDGTRRITGIIDLLLETLDGVVIIDHKSYPGPEATWGKRALDFAPQIAAYAEALRMAGKRVAGQWVSFAVSGGVVRLG
jgi:ATP-dependent helicase/nuclease subunit A